MKHSCLAAFICCLSPLLTHAEQSDVYESIDEIAIGRVFLTSAQRNWLDLHRHDVPVDSGVTPTEAVVPKVAEPAVSPAGYIIKSDGTQQRWSDGDFVSSNRMKLAEMKFPGDIKIIRHTTDNEAESAPTKRAASKVDSREDQE